MEDEARCVLTFASSLRSDHAPAAGAPLPHSCHAYCSYLVLQQYMYCFLLLQKLHHSMLLAICCNFYLVAAPHAAAACA
jgi:hypothetical protein